MVEKLPGKEVKSILTIIKVITPPDLLEYKRLNNFNLINAHISNKFKRNIIDQIETHDI